ncbi:hypothetical protein Tco_0215485 [Tanacetum coccineum]
MLDPPQYTKAVKMTLAQFIKYLSKTTSLIFSPTPPREPTPPRDESKGKEGPLSQEDVMDQLKEIKILADLKAEKKKSEQSLKKLLKNSAIIRARKQKMAEHEAKRQKMFDEYNYQITYRADQLPITKISYRVNSSKEATMRITRANDPLNVTVHDKFRLKTLGFIEWLEAKALGIPPPPELSTFRLSVLAVDKKRKRSSEILEEVFLKENVVVDGMHRNLVPPPGIEGRQGLVIREPKSGIFFYN